MFESKHPKLNDGVQHIDDGCAGTVLNWDDKRRVATVKFDDGSTLECGTSVLRSASRENGAIDGLHAVLDEICQSSDSASEQQAEDAAVKAARQYFPQYRNVVSWEPHSNDCVCVECEKRTEARKAFANGFRAGLQARKRPEITDEAVEAYRRKFGWDLCPDKVREHLDDVLDVLYAGEQ